LHSLSSDFSPDLPPPSRSRRCYRSHALIALRAPLAYEVLQSAQAGLLSRQSLASTICDPALSLYPAERRMEPLEDIEEVMRTDITLANPPSPDRDKAFLRIAYVYSDPLKAQGTLRHLISNIRPKAPAAGQTAVNPDQPYLDEIAVLRSRIAVLEHRYGLVSKPERVMHVSSPSPTALALNILEPPTLPASPESPNRVLFAGCGLAVGILAGLFLKS